MGAQTGSHCRFTFRINSANHSSGEHYGGVAYDDGSSGQYDNIKGSTILLLNSGDYVQVWWHTSGYNSIHTGHNMFCGFLIG